MSAWTDQIWGAVERNGIARRNMHSTAEYGSLFWKDGITELIDEAKRRGYHVVKMGEQLVIFKNAIEVRC